MFFKGWIKRPNTRQNTMRMGVTFKTLGDNENGDQETVLVSHRRKHMGPPSQNNHQTGKCVVKKHEDDTIPHVIADQDWVMMMR